MRGFRINPDMEHVKNIINGLEKKNGHCPCKVGKLDKNLCPCDEFLESNVCHCNLFLPNNEQKKKIILTYGTYDLLHYGHINLLKRAKALGDYLIVALSTDDFNKQKDKVSYQDFETRKFMLEAVKYVDLVIPEENWEQKINDVIEHKVDVVVMGGDWKGSDRFEYLKDYCDVVYLDRTEGVSTTKIKNDLGQQTKNENLKTLK